jgi:hypothetical protein
VTQLESGSIVAEIAPYAMIAGALVTTMGGANTIGDFVRRLSAGIGAFSDPSKIRTDLQTETKGVVPLPSRDDAADIRAFVQPLTGKAGASLNIKHARLEMHSGDRHTLVEYSFDENELNRATVNIDKALSRGDDVVELAEPPEASGESILREAMLFFEQASRKPGKERGRTADRGIVPDVSLKSLPVYFRKSIQSLKDQMIRGQVNPLTNNAFIVDVYVHRDDAQKPTAYIMTDLHRIIPLGE